jgi:hypothetical protein
LAAGSAAQALLEQQQAMLLQLQQQFQALTAQLQHPH